MELLIMWLGTIVVSLGMDIANEMRIFKDVADNGYKIDIRRLTEFGKQINPNGMKATLMSFLIPIWNIVGSFQRTMEYNNTRPMILTQLNAIDVLTDMTKDEQEQYQEKPTGLNAFVLTIESELNENKNIETVSFIDGDEESFISYRKDKNGNRTIIKAEGPVARLSEQGQQAKIDEIFVDMAKAIKERLTDQELHTLLNNAIKKGNSIKLDDIPIKESTRPIIKPSELPLTEKEQLVQLREGIAAIQDQPTEEIIAIQDQPAEETEQSMALKPKN